MNKINIDKSYKPLSEISYCDMKPTSIRANKQTQRITYTEIHLQIIKAGLRELARHAHRHELFCGSGVNSNSAIKNRLGGSRF